MSQTQVERLFIKDRTSLVGDTFRLTTDLSTSDADITANLERVDDALAGHLGSAMSQSSGIFTFPSTGLYYITFTCVAKETGNSRYIGAHIYVTSDDFSSSDDLTYGYNSIDNQSAVVWSSHTVSCIFDVTNTSTHKCKFYVSAAATIDIAGDSNRSLTHMQFIKLGDT